LVLAARASATLLPAQAHVAMHWGDDMLGGQDSQGRPLGGINALTNPAFCPLSRQPELKHTAVRISAAGLPWQLLAAAWLPDDAALALRQALTPWLPQFGFACAVPFGHGRSGVLFRAAAAADPGPAVVAALEALFGLGPARTDTLRYEDRRQGRRRAMGLVRDGDDAHLQAFVLAGDVRSEAWIKTLLQQRLPAQAYGRLLLVPDAKAPVACVAQGAQVCTCLDVREPDILAALRTCSGDATQRLAQLQGRLACGTQGGSCLPTVKRLVQAAAQLA
jgi:assimilatory nitrate reductase catalytic subunit